MRHEKIKIGEISKLFQIPQSRLRYWEDENLIHCERDATNNYRRYTLTNYFEVGDIVFFRDLGVSINELKNLSSMELEDLSRLLEENEVKLDGRIAALEETKQKIRKKRHMIAEIGRLRANSFTLCSPDFEKVIADPLFENSRMMPPLQDVSSCAILLTQDRKEPRYGIIVSEVQPGNTVVWKRAIGAQRYAECLLEISFDHPDNNNLATILHALAALGYRTGSLVGRYLASAFRTTWYEYYQSWIEVE